MFVEGNYGYISIDPWESTNKTISTSISQSAMMRDGSGEHCLRYHYYFTVYDEVNWGQQLSVSIRSENETENEMEVDRVTVGDMRENRWYQRNVTFSAGSSMNYSVRCVCNEMYVMK